MKKLAVLVVLAVAAAVFAATGSAARQGVGLDPIPAAEAARLDGGNPSMQLPAGDPCWSGSVSYTAGTWPLQTTLTDYADWCGYYSYSLGQR